ncbi:DNA replication factor Cdt1 [Trichinella nativa]|uniref:DNA replication factor Cdt1 n=1 Tax=Trichinella nativa TaxID=6335 RepID=A0A0V1L298_9BILA|nr:DNA replication factor Cdt1 [Trichinella nativa]
MSRIKKDSGQLKITNFYPNSRILPFISPLGKKSKLIASDSNEQVESTLSEKWNFIKPYDEPRRKRTAVARLSKTAIGKTSGSERPTKARQLHFGSDNCEFGTFHSKDSASSVSSTSVNGIVLSPKSKSGGLSYDVDTLRNCLKKSGARKNLSAALKNYEENTNSRLGNFISAHVSPKKSLSSDFQSPKKFDSPPAHEQLASLASEQSELALPGHFSFLLDTFRAMDLVISLCNRRDLVTFENVKKSVEKLNRRFAWEQKTFTLHHLGQIKTVYPNAYTFKVKEKSREFRSMDGSHYDFIIIPNVDDDLELPGDRKSTIDNKSETDCASVEVQLPSSPTANKPGTSNVMVVSRKLFTPERLRYRAKLFHEKLLDIVREHHKKFLQSLNPPVELSAQDENRILRWHPNFHLEEVPEIPASELPVIPRRSKPVTCAEFLDKLTDKTKLADPIYDALKKVASAAASDTKTEVSEIDLKDTNVQVKKKNAIPAAVLEKVRAREAMKKKELMFRTSKETQLALRKSRLLDIARILKLAYLIEGKTSMHMDDITTQLRNSYKSLLSKDEIMEHLKLLCDLVPTWIKSYNLDKMGMYFKIASEETEGTLKKLEVIAEESRAYISCSSTRITFNFATYSSFKKCFISTTTLSSNQFCANEKFFSYKKLKFWLLSKIMKVQCTSFTETGSSKLILEKILFSMVWKIYFISISKEKEKMLALLIFFISKSLISADNPAPFSCITCASKELQKAWHLTSFPRMMEEDSFTLQCSDKQVATVESCSTLCVAMVMNKPSLDGKEETLYVRGCLDRLYGAGEIDKSYASKCQEGRVSHFDSQNKRIRSKALVYFCDSDRCNAGSYEDLKGFCKKQDTKLIDCYECADGDKCDRGHSCSGEFCLKTVTRINEVAQTIRTCSSINPLAPVKEFGNDKAICAHIEMENHMWTRLAKPNIRIASDHCYCQDNYCNSANFLTLSGMTIITFILLLGSTCVML